MTKIRTAVFPVAGRGTRFLPATKASPEGNAADRRQAADPVRGRGGACGRRREAGVHHRLRQARHRGSLRHGPRARAGARAAGQAGPARGRARHRAVVRELHLHPPARAARPRPRGAVLAPGRRRRAVLRPSRRRPDRRRGAVPQADGAGLRRAAVRACSAWSTWQPTRPTSTASSPSSRSPSGCRRCSASSRSRSRATRRRTSQSSAATSSRPRSTPSSRRSGAARAARSS